MSSCFRKQLIIAIIDYYSLHTNIDEVEKFVYSQIKNSPDYLRIGMHFLDIIFNCIFILFYFRTFSHLNARKKNSVIKYIKIHQIPLLKLTLRFYESLVILKSTDTLHEEL